MDDHQETHFHMDQDFVNATTAVASSESLDPASKTKLWLKIKIPNNNNKTTSVDHEAGPDAGAGSAADSAAGSPKKLVPGDEGYRVCEYCGKKFTSGKAWGGHKRHHIKTDKNLKKAARKLELSKCRGGSENLKKSESDLAAKSDDGSSKCNNTIKAGDVTVTNGGQPTCCLCGKVFPSMNSLFGHMRFHPDRGWKGTQPPQTTSDKNSSSSSLSEAAATELEVDQIGLEEGLEADRVDLLNSLSSWSKTDKRGRTGFFDPIDEAAFILMTLSHDAGFDKRKIDELLQRKKIDAMDVKAKGKVEQKNVSDQNYSDWLIEYGSKKRKEFGEMLDHGGDETCRNITKKRKKKMIMMSWIDKLNGSETKEGKTGSFGPGCCNIVKKMDRVEESELMDYSHFVDVKGHNILPTIEVKEEKMEQDGSISWGFSSFQCDICHKTFPTGQALGGHKRCHWKGHKAPSSDHIAASNSESSAEANQAAGETSQARHCILGIDLNLPYTIEDGD